MTNTKNKILIEKLAQDIIDSINEAYKAGKYGALVIPPSKEKIMDALTSVEEKTVDDIYFGHKACCDECSIYEVIREKKLNHTPKGEDK